MGKWVHVTAQLDMSAFTATTTTSYIMFDGLDVPAAVTRGGTNPTALVQAGNLEIGSSNGGSSPFDGKLAQVAVFSAKVTQSTIRSYISQGLSGSETNLVSAYSFNNSIVDLNANANNLTANGGAAATATDSPFGQRDDGTTAGTTDYGIITKAAFSTNTTLTVQVPEGCTIPTSGGVSAVSYSTQSVPYGFPAGENKWTVQVNSNSNAAMGSVFANIGDIKLVIPIGSWRIRYQLQVQGARVTSTGIRVQAFLSESTSATTSGYDESGAQCFSGSGSATTQSGANLLGFLNKDYASATAVYTILTQTAVASGALENTNGAQHYIKAIPEYL
jgi:hypothetical protein